MVEMQPIWNICYMYVDESYCSKSAKAWNKFEFDKGYQGEIKRIYSEISSLHKATHREEGTIMSVMNMGACDTPDHGQQRRARATHWIKCCCPADEVEITL